MSGFIICYVTDCLEGLSSEEVAISLLVAVLGVAALVGVLHWLIPDKKRDGKMDK